MLKGNNGAIIGAVVWGIVAGIDQGIAWGIVGILVGAICVDDPLGTRPEELTPSDLSSWR